MTVQPIRLFGDPVLRTPAAPVTDVRRRAAQARRRPHRHDARRGRRRARRAPARRRPAGVHLRLRRVQRTPGQPHVRRRRRRGAGRPRGLPVDPRASAGTAAATCTSSPAAGTSTASRSTIEGSELLARCIQHEIDHLDGVLFVDRLDADDPQGRDGRDPRRPSGSARRSRRGEGRARTRSSGRPGSGVRLVFAGTPEPAVPSLLALLESPRHEVVAVVTRPDAPSGRGPHAAPLAGRRAGRRGRAARCSPRDRPRDPEFLAALRDLGPGLLPGGRLRRARAAGRARRARATAGSTCTSRCCPPGAVPRPCRPRSATATRSPAPPPSGSRRAWTPGRCSAWSPRPSRADDTAGALLRPPRRAPAPPCCSATLDGIADGTPHPAPAAGRGRLARAQGDGGRRPRRLGRAAARRSTGSSARSRPSPGRGRRSATSALGIGPVRTAAGRARAEARRAARREAARARRHRRRTACELGEVRPVGQARDARARLGPRRAHRARRAAAMTPPGEPGAAAPAGPPRQRAAAGAHRPAPARRRSTRPGSRRWTLLHRGARARRVRQPRAARDPARATGCATATRRWPPSSATAPCAPAACSTP